jgi:hypothetical protein
MAMVLLWWAPFWLLGPPIADLLSGLTHPPSAAAVTTAIVVLQTIVGLIGFWLAGTEVKSIIRRSTKRQALKVIWSVLWHGEVLTVPVESASADEGRPPPSEDIGTAQAPSDDG